MAVSVFSNNLPDQQERQAVESVVLEAMADAGGGDWRVQIHAPYNSASWHVTIWGPNSFHWTKEFFGPEEQSPQNGYRAISKAITDVLRPAVYLSYGSPDNSEDFILHLSDLLEKELKVQTGAPFRITRELNAEQGGSPGRPGADDATFLLPVLSPSYFRSEACRKEFELFLGRERQSAIHLIFPVYFVSTTEVTSNGEPQTAWARQLREHGFFDLRQFRFSLDSKEGRQLVVNIATSISAAYADLVKSDPPSSVPLRSNNSPPVAVFLQYIRLRNFKCFDNLELRFDKPSSLEGRWTCIAGINGSGKSSILQAVGLGLLGWPRALELGGSRLQRLRTHSGDLHATDASIDIEIESVEENAPKRWTLTISKDRIMPSGPSLGPDGVENWNERIAVAGYGATRNLAYSTDSAKDNLSNGVRHQITLFDPLSRLTGTEILEGRLRTDWPFLQLFRNIVDQVLGPELKIVLNARDSSLQFSVFDRETVQAIDLPDGFRSAVAWLADLCSLWAEKAPELAQGGDPSIIHAIILIDEIDLHLHPSLQRSLIPRLRKTFPGSQWIVTTHSPLVLANFDANEIVALDRTADGYVRQIDRQILGFSANDIYEWLMGTRPTGSAMEDRLTELNDGDSHNQDEVAASLRISPEVDSDSAQKQVAEFRELLKTLRS